MTPEIITDDAETSLRARQRNAELLGQRALEQVAELERERDELRAEVGRLRAVAEAAKALAEMECWYQDRQNDRAFLRQYLYGITPIADALLAAGMDWRTDAE